MFVRLAVLATVAFSVSANHKVPSDHLSLIEYVSRERQSRIMANISTQEALRLVPSLPKNVLKLLQSTPEKASFLRRAGVGQSEDDSQDQRGVEEARKLLNEMGQESAKNLDAEKIRCSELLDKQALALTAQRNELNNYNSQAAAARGRILESQQTIAAAQELLPTLNDELTAHRQKCAINKHDLEIQLKTAKGDNEVVAGIIPMTKCNTALLQCEQVGDYSDVTFRNPALRNQLTLLQNTDVRVIVRRTLNSIDDDQQPEKKVKSPGSQAKSPGSEARAKTQARCSIRNSPNCQNLRDKFLMMQGEILDQIQTLEEQLAALEATCKKTDEDFVAQISDSETKLNDAQTVLAQSTKAELSAQEQCRLLDASIAQLEAEERQIQEECDKSISDLEMEICGIKQIRQELYKMSKMQKYIQDCEVSAWTAEECSASCLGGTQKLTRTVLVPANMGMACPPLEEKRTCNDFTCPIDCILEDWTGWSACSAECGGGVKQRVRGMLRESAHGGEPCGATSDSEACNTQACDKDCVLSEWTEWSNCSKACDGGTQVRVKDVIEPVIGAGVCSEDDSAERLQRKDCNTDACVVKSKDGLLHCKAMIDVIILLDSSGSIGKRGWEATKKVGVALTSAFKTGADDGAQVSLLEFSGPRTWANYKKCLAGKTTDFEKDCNIKWLAHWETDQAKMKTAIETATWFRSSTLTSASLAMAEAEIGNGRRDAKKITIVITDGRPLSVKATWQAAIKLRKKSRLMFIPVGRNAPIRDTMKWATQPAKENVIRVRNFRDLQGKGTVNRIVADSCTSLDDGSDTAKAAR